MNENSQGPLTRSLKLHLCGVSTSLPRAGLKKGEGLCRHSTIRGAEQADEAGDPRGLSPLYNCTPGRLEARLQGPPTPHSGVPG